MAHAELGLNVMDKFFELVKEQGVIELREYPKTNAEFVKDEREKTVEKDLQAIYEYFDNYSSKEINMIDNLDVYEPQDIDCISMKKSLNRNKVKIYKK